MKKVFRKTLGIVLIVLGFLALITPFSPGSWLMLIGLEILGFGFLFEGRLSASLEANLSHLLFVFLCYVSICVIVGLYTR